MCKATVVATFFFWLVQFSLFTGLFFFSGNVAQSTLFFANVLTIVATFFFFGWFNFHCSLAFFFPVMSPNQHFFSPMCCSYSKTTVTWFLQSFALFRCFFFFFFSLFFSLQVISSCPLLFYFKSY